MATTTFAPMARVEARALGMAKIPLFTVPHPLDKMTPEQIKRNVAAITKGIAESLQGGARNPAAEVDVPLEAVDLKEIKTEENAYDYFLARGWTDGLPIIAPEPDVVKDFLDKAGFQRDMFIGHIPPMLGEATVEKIAINAVMAGCLPEYLGVIITALEAMLEEPFNLYGVQATTNPVTPMLVLSGPVASRLGVNGGIGALGPGWRSNATIGRAIRLCLLNIGGGRPGQGDQATHGMPGKFTFCFAENDSENPWEPLNVDLGYDINTSTVTVIGASGSLNIIDQGSQTGEGLLKSFTSAMSIVGTNNIYFGGDPVLILSPEHAHTLADDGFDKSKIRNHLWTHAVVPLAEFSQSNVENILKKRRPHLFSSGVPGAIPVADKPDDIIILVAGGPGKHSVFIPTFGVNRAVSKVLK